MKQHLKRRGDAGPHHASLWHFKSFSVMPVHSNNIQNFLNGRICVTESLIVAKTWKRPVCRQVSDIIVTQTATLTHNIAYIKWNQNIANFNKFVMWNDSKGDSWCYILRWRSHHKFFSARAAYNEKYIYGLWFIDRPTTKMDMPNERSKNLSFFHYLIICR